jgi:hypothetical protein
LNKRIIIVAVLTALAACSPADEPNAGAAPEPHPMPTAENAGFVNRVWAVAESQQVEIGALRVFLADGTLVMASNNSKPAFGSWSQDGNGRLTITEEGRPYDTDIVELTDTAFRIRMQSPGDAVEMLLKPAPQEAIDMLHIDERGTAP